MSEPETRSPIARSLRDGVSEAELASAWSAIERRRARRPVSRAAWVAAPLAAAAVAALAVIAQDGEPAALPAASPAPAPVAGPIARSDGSALGLHLGEGTIALDEGSRIDVDEGSELEVLANAPDQVVLHLRAGGARFSITPGGPRRWRVEGGGVSVEVVGTVFSVRREGGRARVAVERGVVVVRGARVPDGVRRLGAGESIDVGPEPAVAPSATSEREPTELDPGIAAAVEAGIDPAVEPGIDPAAVEARAQPRRAPVASRIADDAARLLDDADHARREGRSDDAIALLGRIVDRHPRAPEAPIAAYTRGRLLGAAGRDDEARRAYQRALELGLPPALEREAREALAR